MKKIFQKLAFVAIAILSLLGVRSQAASTSANFDKYLKYLEKLNSKTPLYLELWSDISAQQLKTRDILSWHTSHYSHMSHESHSSHSSHYSHRSGY